MKKMLSLALALAMTVSLCSCGGGSDTPATSGSASTSTAAPAENKPITLVAGCTAGETHPYAKTILNAMEKLEEISDGSITIDYQGGGVLGGEVSMIEQEIMGEIDIAVCADMSYGQYAPTIYALSFPGVFADYAEVEEEYWNGWGRELVEEQLATQNLKVLGVFDNGFRWFSNNKAPVTTIDGLAGQKVRIPENEFYVSFWEAIGCQPATVALGELAVALQQGVVDAQELGPNSTYPRGVHLYQKYWTESCYSYSGCVVSINQDSWDSMSAQQQEWMKEAFAYSEEVTRPYTQELMNDYIEKMEAEGCEVIRGEFDGKAELIAAAAAIGKETAINPPYDQYISAELLANMYPS